MKIEPYLYVFVDDVREPPDELWVIARNYTSALLLLRTGLVKVISLDHDLGLNKYGAETLTGYDIAKWIEGEVYHGNLIAPEIQVHSANPVGRKNIEAAIVSIKRFPGAR